MANEYVTWATLEATLGLTGETFADADGAAAVEAASRAVDGYCERRFYADSDANQIRYYQARNSNCLAIHDLVTLTAIAVDTSGDQTFSTTWTQNTHFVLDPLNAAADGKPYTRINVMPLGGSYFPYYYPRSVKITGKWGWPTVPAPIVDATSILATRILKRRREAPFGIVSFGDEAVRIARTDPDLALLLAPYVRSSPL